MKVKDILDQKHTVLCSTDGYYYHQGLSDYNQTNLKLRDILFVLGHKYEKAIDKLRELPYHGELQQFYKKEFPCWFVGGTFPMQETEDKDILTYSNILAIDIDKIDNPNIDLDNIIKKIYELPYVFAVFKSISGEGYYVLVLIKDGKNTLKHYKYIENLYKNKYGIIIDPHCTNIGRKRYISYQDDISDWIKPLYEDIKPFCLLLNEEITNMIDPQVVRLIDYKQQSIKFTNEDDFTRKAIWKLLDGGYSIDDMNTSKAYSTWYHVACEFRTFEDGYDMFVRFSQNSSKYNDKIRDIKKKWDSSTNNKNKEDVCRKWCGICKRVYGANWWLSS